MTTEEVYWKRVGDELSVRSDDLVVDYKIKVTPTYITQ
jgi:hypothetical protein